VNATKQLRYTLPFLLFVPVLLPAQEATETTVQSRGVPSHAHLRLFPGDSVYMLPRGYITEMSEKVSVDSVRLLARTKDYEIDYTTGKLTLHNNLVAQSKADTAQHWLSVEFVPLPFEFRKEYRLHELVIKKDSAGRKEITIAQPPFRFAPQDFFEKGFQKSGSLMRGFTIGSNQDLTLNSGFRMQLNGALSKEINVTAALTDENSPIQPEGTTQTLREVDKVFVNVKSRRFDATLGDFDYEVNPKEGGEFGRLSRKLQGASGSALFDNIMAGNLSAAGTVTAATARGKFTTNNLQGVDGNQGPYRLAGNSGEQQIIVLAGTERVYLNGELMTRGELNDYTIDYASGEVTFTNRRLITNASRITIDFEYSDQQYTRNLIAVTTSESILHNKVKFNAVVAQEADDTDSPIDVTLDDTSRSVLRNSGSDQIRASLPGIKYVGFDSVGRARGQYVRRDTIINGKTYQLLFYAPGDAQAVYSATFSAVQNMPPDSAGYSRIASGQYRFAGIGQGNYLPIQLLPMPQLHRSIDLNGKLELAQDLTVSGEYAATRFDQNRFSPPDANNAGGAMKFALEFKPKQVRVFNADIGSLDLNVSERYVDKTFAPLDRYNDVEFDRKWNLTGTSAANEEIREASVSYAPVHAFTVGGGYGLLDRSGQTKSIRTHGELTFRDTSAPTIQYNFENIANDDYYSLNSSSWFRQHGSVDYRIGALAPGIRLETEDRTISGQTPDSLISGGFKILEIDPRLAVEMSGSMTGSAEFQIRTEDSSSAGLMQRASRSLTQMYSWQLSEWRDLSSTLSFSLRSVTFSDEFKKHGNTDGEFMLVRSQSRYAPLSRAIQSDLYYEFASQRSSRLQRVFLRVPKGTGNYLYLGDLNGNGIADESEFRLTQFDGDYVVIYVPSTQLYPVVDLKSSVRIRLQPSRIVRTGTSIWQRILKAVSTETYLRIEEKSSDPVTRHIYLMNFQYFQNDSTTISGSSQVQEDLFLFENSPDLSFRFRFNQNNGFVQLVSANERSLLREQSIRMRSQLSSEIGNQTDIVNKLDRVMSNVPTSRERDISTSSLTSDFSYRPEIQWEIGFNFAVSRAVDGFENENTTADLNGQGVRLTYGFSGAGQLRASFDRKEVTLSNVHPDPIRGIPYELTDGNAVGKNYLWQLAFDYRINQNMQVSLQYSGRSEGGRPPVHLARAEAKAFF
jgi:hypothetical protein